MLAADRTTSFPLHSAADSVKRESVEQKGLHEYYQLEATPPLVSLPFPSTFPDRWTFWPLKIRGIQMVQLTAARLQHISKWKRKHHSPEGDWFHKGWIACFRSLFQTSVSQTMLCGPPWVANWLLVGRETDKENILSLIESENELHMHV